MTIGERIKLVRGDTSRDKFAPHTGISKTALVNYETGERIPPSDYLVRLLELYPDISPAWLLVGEGEMIRGGHRTHADWVVLDGIAKKIKIIRGDQSLELFADSLEVSKEELQAIEEGKLEPSYGFLWKLCFDYDVNAAWLLEDKGIMKHSDSRGLTDELFVRVVQACLITFPEARDKHLEARKHASMAFDIMALIGELRKDIPDYTEIISMFQTFIMFYKTLLSGELKFKESDLPKIMEYMIMGKVKQSGD